MKQTKKSQAKLISFLLTGILILSLGILLHPSTRSLFPHYRTNLFKELIPAISSSNNEVSLAQDFWEFREFYSRGEISLDKYSHLSVSEEITSIFKPTDGFIPYLQFKSNKIISFEGTLSNNASIFVPRQDFKIRKWKNWSIKADSDKYQVLINEVDKQALIITRFKLETASKANGYLHFDLREDKFEEKHKDDVWITISLINLN